MSGCSVGSTGQRFFVRWSFKCRTESKYFDINSKDAADVWMNALAYAAPYTTTMVCYCFMELAF